MCVEELCTLGKSEAGSKEERGRRDREKGEGKREIGNRPDAAQFTSRLRDWLSYGLGCICEDIYRRPLRAKGHRGDRSLGKVRDAGWRARFAGETADRKSFLFVFLGGRKREETKRGRKLDFTIPYGIFGFAIY